MPKFTVIIPTYNRLKLLLETIESVRQQTFHDYEIVVVDDFSVDDVTPSVKAVDPSIRVVRQSENKGLAAARNAGLRAAQGEYVALLDDDDLWMPWTLETYASAILEYSQPAIVSANGVYFDHDNGCPSVERANMEAILFRDYFTYRTNPVQPGWLIPSGFAIRRDVALCVGGFDASIDHHEDEDMWLQLGDAPGFVRVAAPACWAYRAHAGSMSSKLNKRFSNLRRIFAKERNGEYPGGATRRGQRLDIISQLGRHVARLGAREGYPGEGWALYQELFQWNLERSRWAFLLFFPAEMVANPVLRAFGKRGPAGR